MLTKTNELEAVNWNLVKHYVFQAENAMNAMQAAYSEEARQRLFEVALRFMLQAQQQVDHCLTGRTGGNDDWKRAYRNPSGHRPLGE